MKRIEPFLLGSELVNTSEVEALVAEALRNVKHDDFCEQISGMTAYGYKPR